MNGIRRVMPLLALAALAAAGCMLTSGQFAVTYGLPDPITVNSSISETFDVDLNTVSEYNDHKDQIKRVEDMALVGQFTNNGASDAQIEVWLVRDPSQAIGPPQQNGTRLWGPLTLAGHASEKVDWDRSAALFDGRQALIDEVKGDGSFRLYIVTTGLVNVTVTKGSLIVVVGAAV
jgi:hypothetical protein